MVDLGVHPHSHMHHVAAVQLQQFGFHLQWRCLHLCELKNLRGIRFHICRSQPGCNSLDSAMLLHTVLSKDLEFLESSL